MTRIEMIAALDQEIQRLEAARLLLRNTQSAARGMTLRKVMTGPAAKAPPAKRQISVEGRRRIVEAQRRRWAAQKKQQNAKAS